MKLEKIFMEEDLYEIIFFKKENGRKPVLEYLTQLPEKERVKILDHIKSLSVYPEFRREPQSRHLTGKLRELKVDFGNNRYRIIYFFYIGKKIIIVHAFGKKTGTTPRQEIDTALRRMNDFLNAI